MKQQRLVFSLLLVVFVVIGLSATLADSVPDDEEWMEFSGSIIQYILGKAIQFVLQLFAYLTAFALFWWLAARIQIYNNQEHIYSPAHNHSPPIW